MIDDHPEGRAGSYVSEVQNRRGGARVRVPPPFVFLTAMAAGWWLDWNVRAMPVPLSETWCLVATVVAGTVGLALIVSPLVLFKRSGQEPEPWKPSPELIGRGPYRFSRNPMYVGMLLLQCSVGFAFNSVWVLLLAAPALLGIHYLAVLPEERYLTHKFGAGYSRYAEKTARYLGWPR